MDTMKDALTLDQRMQGFGMNPNLKRRALLPDYSAEDGFIAPQWAYDVAKGAVLPGHVAQGGNYQLDDVTNMAAALAGTGYTGASMQAIKHGVPKSTLGINVFQGGPHKYGPEGASESLKHMSKGEGAQAYGYGRYDAESEGVANEYYKALSDTFTEAGGKRIHQTGHGGRSFGDLDARQRGLLNELESVATARKKTAKEVIDERLSYNAEMRKGYEAEIAKSEKGSFPEQLSQEHLATIDHDEQFLRKLLDEDVNFKTEGYLYKHDLPDEDIARYLDWDAPLSEQPESVRKALKLGNFPDAERARASIIADDTGQWFHSALDADMGSKQAASEALGKAGIPGLKYYDGMSRNKPIKDIKKSFQDELPDNAEFDEIDDLLGTGHFSPDSEEILQALKGDDWFGFDYPSQAISAALGKNINNWEPSVRLTQAIAKAREGGTRNYVTWDQEVLDRMKLLERNNEDMTKALMQK